MDLRKMSDKVLQSVLDQALATGETDLAVMVRNEILWRDNSDHEETDPIHPMPGANWVWHPHEPLTTEKPEPRLWPPRQVKAQPVAPHDTNELTARVAIAQIDKTTPQPVIMLLGDLLEQLRWYADNRTAGEVRY
jgi:hypothetical protein